MADTGYNWDAAWSFVQKSGTGDWDGLAIADNASAYSAAIALDGKAACIVGMDIAHDATAVSGVVTIAVLGDANGTNFEAIPGLAGAQVGAPYKFSITPVASSTVYVQFSIDPKYYDDCLIAILDEGGGTITTDVRIKYATIPVAS